MLWLPRPYLKVRKCFQFSNTIEKGLRILENTIIYFSSKTFPSLPLDPPVSVIDVRPSSLMNVRVFENVTLQVSLYVGWSPCELTSWKQKWRLSLLSRDKIPLKSCVGGGRGWSYKFCVGGETLIYRLFRKNSFILIKLKFVNRIYSVIFSIVIENLCNFIFL